MALGTRIGVLILAKARPRAVKWVIVAILFLAGIGILLKGLGVWM